MSGGDGVDAVVSSPPFTQGYAGGGGINVKGYGPDGADKVGERTYQGTGAEREPGNLETLTLGAVEAVVTSPPYQKANTGGLAIWDHAERVHDRTFSEKSRRGGYLVGGQESVGSLANEQGETFWQAAQQVVR